MCKQRSGEVQTHCINGLQDLRRDGCLQNSAWDIQHVYYIYRRMKSNQFRHDALVIVVTLTL